MKRPNILILMADQMVADVVSRGHACRMPNAQRLADRGVRFTRAATVTPHCCPARASFFTGHLPSRHGVWNSVEGHNAFNRDLKPGIGTFAEQLGSAGYRMAFAGKWHVSVPRSPADFGWTILPTKVAPKPPPVGPPHARSIIDRPGWGKAKPIFRTLPTGAADAMQGGRIDAGVDAIRAFAQDRTAPWCMFLGVDPPHDPYEAPQDYLDLYPSGSVELPASFRDDLSDKPRIAQRQRGQVWDQLGEEGARECLRHYYASCSVIDAWLGRLLDALDETNQSDDTVVVFMSDHGDYAGAHGLWCKGVAAFREAYAIPAIVGWPAGIAAPGRDSDALVSITDFAPTFLELAGLAVPEGIYGRSLLPLLRASDEPDDWREALVSQFNGVELYYSQRAVWTRDWKYVFNGFDSDELYDLRRDPGEMCNLADPARWRDAGESRLTGPYPPLPPTLDGTRRHLWGILWQTCAIHGDRGVSGGYWTVGLAPYGPNIAEVTS